MKKLLLGDYASTSGRVRPDSITAADLASAIIFPHNTATDVFASSGGPADPMYLRIEGLFAHVPMESPGKPLDESGQRAADSANEELRLLTTGADQLKSAYRTAESEGRLMWPNLAMNRWEQLAMLLRHNGVEVPAELPTDEYSVNAVRQWIETAGLDIEIL